MALIWRLGWLRGSGIGRLGGWAVWLLAIGGLAYGTSASLYSFYGRVALPVGWFEIYVQDMARAKALVAAPGGRVQRTRNSIGEYG